MIASMVFRTCNAAFNLPDLCFFFCNDIQTFPLFLPDLFFFFP